MSAGACRSRPGRDKHPNPLTRPSANFGSATGWPPTSGRLLRSRLHRDHPGCHPRAPHRDDRADPQPTPARDRARPAGGRHRRLARSPGTKPPTASGHHQLDNFSDIQTLRIELGSTPRTRQPPRPWTNPHPRWTGARIPEPPHEQPGIRVPAAASDRSTWPGATGGSSRHTTGYSFTRCSTTRDRRFGRSTNCLGCFAFPAQARSARTNSEALNRYASPR